MNRVALAKIGVASLLVMLLAGCGGGSHKNPPPPLSFSNTSLKGAYVFAASGTDAVDGDFAVAGSFQADGAGNITSGLEDLNLGSGIDSNVKISGTYTIGPTGAGIVNLNDVNGAVDSFGVQLVQSGASAVTAFDNDAVTGTLETQNTSGFSRAGAYTFNLSGSGNGPITATGSFNADAGGNISGGTQTITEGAVTTNNPAVTGFAANTFDAGRGTIVFGGNDFSYYVVSANRIILLGLDTNVFLHGDAKK